MYELTCEGCAFNLMVFMGDSLAPALSLSLGLQIAARAARRLMVFQSMILAEVYEPVGMEDCPMSERDRLSHTGWPRMSFVERKLQGDSTN